MAQKRARPDTTLDLIAFRVAADEIAAIKAAAAADGMTTSAWLRNLAISVAALSDVKRGAGEWAG